MSSGHQRITWRRNIAENFNRLSRVRERYRQTPDDRQTDGRTTTYIANMNMSSRSLIIVGCYRLFNKKTNIPTEHIGDVFIYYLVIGHKQMTRFDRSCTRGRRPIEIPGALPDPAIIWIWTQQKIITCSLWWTMVYLGFWSPHYSHQIVYECSVIGRLVDDWCRELQW